MSMELQTFKNKFKLVQQITWDDIFDKFDYEYRNREKTDTGSYFSSPADSFLGTLVLRDHDYRTPNIENALKEAQDSNIVPNSNSIDDMQFYCSLSSESLAGSMHSDQEDVLLIQCKGLIKYQFDRESVTLSPGDALFIPRLLSHKAVVLEPRITMSLSWMDGPEWNNSDEFHVVYTEGN